MRKLRVGVVGSGWVAQHRHIPCWRQVGAEIVSVCTRASPVETVKRVKVAHVTAHLENLIKQKPDVVSVCSPPQYHLEHTRMLVEGGIPVLLEKPLVATVEEAESLRYLVLQSGVPVCPAHSFRFCSAVRGAWDALSSGEAGELIAVAGVQLSSFARRLPTWFGELHGGLYWDEAPHLLYLLDAFLGKAELMDSRVAWEGSPTPRTVSAELSGERGVGSLRMVFGSGVSEWHVVIVATKRVIDIDLFRDICIVLPSDGAHDRVGVARTSLSMLVQHVVGFGASGWKHLRGKLYYGHDELIRQFAEKLEPPVNLLEEGLRTVCLTHGILQCHAIKSAS
ncbi:MAG: Gfo/Idh/MocA family protein [Dehalococcoidia bacterium]